MPEFKRGDLVWVAYLCPHNIYCRGDYGTVFQISGTMHGDAMCRECKSITREEQFVVHPRIAGPGHYIPSRFLRLIPPLSEEDKRDQEVLVQFWESLNAKAI